MSARRISRWLHGTASAGPAGARIRIHVEGKSFTGEIYVTKANARELRDRLDYLLRSTS